MRENEQITRPHAKKMRRELTRAEAIIWNTLRSIKIDGVTFRRQYTIGYYIADFACVSMKLVIEVDGATHTSAAEVTYDKKRDEFMKNDGWEIIRVWNNDVFNNLRGVMQVIETRVHELSLARAKDVAPPPSALRAATSSVNGERIERAHNPPPFPEVDMYVEDRAKRGGGGEADG